MKVIRRVFQVISVAFLLITISGQPASAVKRKQRVEKSRRSDRRQLSVKADRRERARLALRRSAVAARLAAEARQRAAEQAMRASVQSMIARDDVTGEDPEIRRVAVNALGNHAGTVVVMNPKTGRIYAIVNQQWGLQEGFKPCSTIKLVTSLAGLNERVIDPADTAAISESNKVSLTHALAHSSNAYFQEVGGQVGYSKMISYARTLGLGQKTGINKKNEFAGHLPKPKSGFALNRMSSHGDGFQVTAVQLATLVSAIANGGKLLTPFVARNGYETRDARPDVRRVLDLNSDSLKHIVPGMTGAVSYGSGRKAFDPSETVAGKTGTCIEGGNWVGLFTSYAPVKDPKLAVVVIARGPDGRNHFPAAVAGRIYRGLNLDTLENLVAKNTAIRKADEVAVSHVTETVAAGTNDEELEGNDAEAAPSLSKRPRLVRPAQTRASRSALSYKVKRTSMAIRNARVKSTLTSKISPKRLTNKSRPAKRAK